MRCLRVTAPGMEHPLAPQRRKNLGPLTKSVTQRVRPLIRIQYLGRTKSAYGNEGGTQSNPQFDFDLRTLDAIGNVVDCVESALQMQDGLAVGSATQGPTGRQLMMRYGAPGFAPTLEVLGSLGGDRIQPTAPGKLEPRANSCMTERASSRSKPVIEELAIEVVSEGVKLSDGSVGPCLLAGCVDKNASARQACAVVFDFRDVASDGRSDGSGREFPPDNACCA